MSWSTSSRRERLPTDWPVVRRRVLARDLLCQCTGCSRCSHQLRCVRASTEVDHARRGDDHSAPNLRGMCGGCHSVKSAREGGTAAAARRGSQRRPTEQHPALKR